MTHIDRKNPFISCIKERFLLSQKSSTKKTYHLSLLLSHNSIQYQPGDVAAVLPSNDANEVEKILHHLHLNPDAIINATADQPATSAYDFFMKRANLQKSHPSLFKTIHERSPHSQNALLFLSENKSKLTEFIETHRPHDLLALHPHTTILPNELPHLFLPLLPRLYSIASSPLIFPNEIQLIVTLIEYELHNQKRLGVASHFLCNSAIVQQTPIPIYIQTAHHFLLPTDPSTPIILVGSGTGIAPYRAFLQHRVASHSLGRNWLFFGERHRANDYYYQDFFEKLKKDGHLRLDLAFSRDQEEKIYVQHRLWEQRKDIWAWINEGAYFYVCGDAKNMAKDVLATMQQIAKVEGNMTDEQAHDFVKNLRSQKRYLLDVY